MFITSQVICLFIHNETLKGIYWDFPGGPVVKNPPSNAGDTGSIPGRRTKIPHAVGQLSPTLQLLSIWAKTREPECRNYRTHALWCPHATIREKTAHCNKEPVRRSGGSRMPQQRSHVPQLRPNTAKTKINK